MSEYTAQDFADDLVLSQLGAHMKTDAEEMKIAIETFDRPSYELGAFDAYLNIATARGLVQGAESKVEIEELAMKARRRMDDHSERVES